MDKGYNKVHLLDNLTSQNSMLRFALEKTPNLDINKFLRLFINSRFKDLLY